MTRERQPDFSYSRPQRWVSLPILLPGSTKQMVKEILIAQFYGRLIMHDILTYVKVLNFGDINLFEVLVSYPFQYGDMALFHVLEVHE